MHACGFTVGQKNGEKSGLGHWAAGQPGCWASGPRAIGGHGPRATGPWACKLKVPTVSTIKGIDCKYLYGTFNKLYAPYKNKTSR